MGRVNEDLTREIRQSRFQMTGFRVGYHVDEVDDFLDELCAAIERGEDVTDLVEHAQFSPVKRKGYDMQQVDALLDRIVGRPTGRALKNTLDPTPDPGEPPSDRPPAVVQEQVGLLGRLFGRRG
jgi:DivIVA domain-containing protein